MDATSAPDMMQVMHYLDQFYTTSWNHLLVVIGVMGVLVGGIIPMLISVYQRRAMRHERSQIQEAIVGQVSTEVRDRMGQEKALLEEKVAAGIKSLEEKLARDRAELEELVRKGIAQSEGLIYHVQANTLLQRKVYLGAYISGVDGIGCLFEGRDLLNLRRLLKVVTSGCLPMITKEELEKEVGVAKEFNELMDKIEKSDADGNFQDAVRDARRAFKDASKRVAGEKAS